MEPEQLKQAAATDWRLIVAFIALAVSLGTFAFNTYFQIFRSARVSVVLGDIFTLRYMKSKQLTFHRPLTIFNDGAKYAAVISIRGEIFDESDPTIRERFRWRSFVESTDIGEKGKEFKPWWGFKSWVSTLIISGHSAECENISFFTESPFVLSAGEYGLTYTLYGHEGELCTISERFSISYENYLFLEERCTAGEGRVSQSTLMLARDIEIS